MSSTQNPTGRGHAVVIGTSITGMLTARILADHFQRVTILDQDDLPDSPVTRRGVPQAGHIHQVMARGSQIFEQLFPGIIGELESHGAIHFDFAESALLQILGQKVPRFQSGVRSVSASRALLEWVVGKRLRGVQKVTVMPQTYALRLQADGNGPVRGIVVRQGGSSGPETVLEADLVVDASGRGSHAPQWLEALGRAKPTEKIIKPGLAYTTRWFRVPESAKVPEVGNWVIVGTMPDFPNIPYSGAIARVENGQMICSLVGYGNVTPPDDDASFLEYAKKVPQPYVYQFIRDAEPISPIYKFRGGVNLMRRYDEVQNWPEGFAVVGDAACTFNPAYGQGMTVAGMGAMLLGESVAQGQSCQTFQKRLIKLYQNPWMMVAGEDSLWEMGDKATAVQKLASSLQKQLLRTLFATQEGTQHFYEIMHMLRPPAAMVNGQGLKQLSRGAMKRMTGEAAREEAARAV